MSAIVETTKGKEAQGLKTKGAQTGADMNKREMTAYYLAKAEKATHETTLSVGQLAQTYLKGCGCLRPLTVKEMNHRIKLYGFAK